MRGLFARHGWVVFKLKKDKKTQRTNIKGFRCAGFLPGTAGLFSNLSQFLFLFLFKK
jgi:hypothetical protein